MEYILTSEEMKRCDELTSLQYHIPAIVLMERAALETARIIMDRFGTDISVGIYAGSGNNGGDGIAIARILKEYQVDCEIVFLGDLEHCSELTKQQLCIANEYNISIHYILDSYPTYDVIVDALFGIGLSRPIEGIYKKAIEQINESKAKVVAVDIPSGVSADNGEILGSAIKADVTVTYAFKKLGQLFAPGVQYVGELICVPIGIPESIYANKGNGVVTFSKNDLQLPKRNPLGNKGTFGKVLLIAGSREMGGASHLASLSSFRIGAGMVKIYTAEENRDTLLKRIPEAMVSTYQDDNNPLLLDEEIEQLVRSMDWADVIAIGPGLSLSLKARFIVKYVMNNNHSNKPLVIDADALNIISESEELLSLFDDDIDFEVVMTPHIGEFSRLIRKPVNEIKANFLNYCRSFTQKYNVTLVCKDYRTIVTKRHKLVYVNTCGNDGMATAGSGDVLTGVIAGLVAQGMDVHEAAVMGTLAHGIAGDIAKDRSSKYYIMSQDIIHALKEID